MKAKSKGYIEIMPILGAGGLMFVLLYFLLLNVGNGYEVKQRDSESYRLFFKLYKKLGYRITPRYLSRLPQPQGNLAIYLDYSYDDAEWEALMERWVKKGGTLMIAGVKDQYDPLSANQLTAHLLKSIVEVTHGQTLDLRQNLQLKGKTFKHLPLRHQLDSVDILLTSERGPLCYQKACGAGKILLLTDSGLLKNQSLREGRVALFFNDLFQAYYNQHIFIIDPKAPQPNRTTPLLKLLFSGKLLYITMQTIVVLFLFIIWQSKIFGNPRSQSPYRHRAISEHLKAVGYWYQKTGSAAVVDAINCEFFCFRLAKMTGLQINPPNFTLETVRKLKDFLAVAGTELTIAQLKAILTEVKDITPTQLQRKAKLQDQILKTLKQDLKRQ